MVEHMFHTPETNTIVFEIDNVIQYLYTSICISLKIPLVIMGCFLRVMLWICINTLLQIETCLI